MVSPKLWQSSGALNHSEQQAISVASIYDNYSLHPEIQIDLSPVGVQHLAPTHRSGDTFREMARRVYGRDYVDFGVGRTIRF